MHIRTTEMRLFIRICGLGEGASSAEMHISTSETRRFICIKGLGGGSSRAKMHIKTQDTRQFICIYGLGEGVPRAKLHISTSETRHLICTRMWCYEFVARSPNCIAGSKEKASGRFAGTHGKPPGRAHDPFTPATTPTTAPYNSILTPPRSAKTTIIY